MHYPIGQANALLRDDKFTDGEPGNYPPSPDKAEYQNNVYDEILNVIIAGGLVPDYAQKNQMAVAIATMLSGKSSNGHGHVIGSVEGLSAALNSINEKLSIVDYHRTCVRQTVLSGPRDADHNADYLEQGSTGTKVKTKATVSDSPLLLSFADGFDMYGNRNMVREIASATAGEWTLTSDSNNNYLFIETAAFSLSASLTFGQTPLAPIYAHNTPAGAAVGQYWFCTQHYKGFVYNGSAWLPVLRVYVGQAKSNGTAVSDIVSYAYMGIARFITTTAYNLGGSATFDLDWQDALGVNADAKDVAVSMISTVAGLGMQVGEIVDLYSTNSTITTSGGVYTMMWVSKTSNISSRLYKYGLQLVLPLHGNLIWSAKRSF